MAPVKVVRAPAAITAHDKFDAHEFGADPCNKKR
jgi:hypothetical protein